MKNVFYKHKGPEATKCYMQLLKSYNQQVVMSSNIYSYAKHESYKYFQYSNFFFWGERKEDKADLSLQSSPNILPAAYNKKS